MKTSPQIRTFYDREYYQGVEIGNPAQDIYDQLRIKQIRDLLTNQPGKALLVGCGSHRDLTILSNCQDVFAFDLSFEAIRKIRTSHVSLFTGDALQIPISDHTFDIVICSEVLEHIPDIRSAVRELRRVIKPGGTLVVSSPNWISWFGLTRFVAEKLTKKAFHSEGQPYDDWKIWYRYRKELSPEFDVLAYRGIWYLPPLHFRKRGVSRLWMKRIYKIYAPFERLLCRWLPVAGHLILVKCKAN
jgi:SAM-dependent methyltransferase